MNAAIPEPADRQVNQYTSTPFDGTRDYDRNGNLVHKASSGETLSYDYHDQMVQVTGPGGTHTYGYDAFGRRILADGGQFFSDRDDTIEQRTVAGAPKSIYVFGDRIDEILMGVQDVDGNNTPDRVAYHADDMGNVMAVTNGLGTVLESYDYDNYGKPKFFNAAGSPIALSAIGNALLFNGHRYDSETGLYDYRTRYLDPRAGRFTSRDSIGTWRDDGNLGNGNAYAGNNPWSATDPMGTSLAQNGYLLTDEPARKLVVCPCPNWAPDGTVCYCWSGMNPGDGGGSNALGNTYAMYSTQKGTRIKPKPTELPPLTHPLTCLGGVCGMAPGGGGSGGGANAMKNGTVKFFNETKGFGFAVSDPMGGEGGPALRMEVSRGKMPEPGVVFSGGGGVTLTADGSTNQWPMIRMAHLGGAGSSDSDAMKNGTVKFFNEAKGFGFAPADPTSGGSEGGPLYVFREVTSGGAKWICRCLDPLFNCHNPRAWNCLKETVPW